MIINLLKRNYDLYSNNDLIFLQQELNEILDKEIDGCFAFFGQHPNSLHVSGVIININHNQGELLDGYFNGSFIFDNCEINIFTPICVQEYSNMKFNDCKINFHNKSVLRTSTTSMIIINSDCEITGNYNFHDRGKNNIVDLSKK